MQQSQSAFPDLSPPKPWSARIPLRSHRWWPCHPSAHLYSLP